MKRFLLLLGACALLQIPSHAQLLKKIGDKLKNKSEQKAEEKTTEPSVEKPVADEQKTDKSDNDQAVQEKTADHPPTLKVYQNYDFVPGDRIIFEDNFSDDQDGEFPTHWELKSGQAVLNKTTGQEALYITEGNYARLAPRMKNDKYLSDTFTIEYDYYYVPGAYGSLLLMKGYDTKEGFERESNISVGNSEASFSGTMGGVSLSKSYPEELKENFDNHWHHVAIIKKGPQLKVYVDQFRTLVVPDTKEVYESLQFAGIGDEREPIVITNIRVALGGSMNMVGKKFTESKIVTHGINFDIDKATLRPESMGTLNMIVQIMKDNPDVKFEIDGHTDNTGTAAHNLTLSQQRADAVRAELVKLGVDEARLTTKGWGDTHPISDNSTFDGRANNRRVEFVKQ